jgi:osmotically-inducible protein OsmY
MVAGAVSLADRRTTAAQAEDQTIELKAFTRLRDRFKSEPTSISVTSFNRIVLVTGYVPNQAAKTEAIRMVSAVENVRSVLDELVVGPKPSLQTYGTDTVLTTRVKTALIAAKDIQGNVVKVYTESSTVFLMGIVTDREATRAADIASRVSGVRRVVRAFEVISEAELGRIQQQQKDQGTSPAPTATSSGSVSSSPSMATDSAGGAGAVVTPIR